MDTRHVVTVLLCIVIASCGQPSRQELTQTVLHDDPSFAALLERRDTIEQAVRTLRAQLDTERDTFRAQARTMEREYDMRRDALEQQVRVLLRQLGPEEDRLALSRETLDHRIRLQSSMIRGLERTVNDLEEGMGDRAQEAMRPDELTARQRELAARTAELEQTQALLKQHERQRDILDAKIRLLRLR